MYPNLRDLLHKKQYIIQQFPSNLWY